MAPPSTAVLTRWLLLTCVSAHLAAADGRGVYTHVPLKPKDAALIEISGELGDMLKGRGALLEDGPATRLVSRVGQRVVPADAIEDYVDFRFQVLHNPVPNAFALPDGQIYVHTGLLALLESEAQLAAVLAHEAMHVEGHHSIVNARQARKKRGGLAALGILGGAVGVPAGDLAGFLFAKSIISYGRDLEEEADRRSVARLLDAGYDPREMPRVFELLDEDPEGERAPVKVGWSNHPLNVTRSTYVREMLRQMGPEIAEASDRHGGLIVGEDGFAEAVRQARFAVIEQLNEADRPRSAIYLAERTVRRWPDSADAQALLGDSWRTLDARTATVPEEQLTKKAKKARMKDYVEHTREERQQRRLASADRSSTLEANRTAAAEAYTLALSIDGGHPRALKGLGLIHEARAEDMAAGRYFAAYIRAAPEATDKSIILQKLADITRRLQQ